MNKILFQSNTDIKTIAFYLALSLPAIPCIQDNQLNYDTNSNICSIEWKWNKGNYIPSCVLEKERLSNRLNKLVEMYSDDEDIVPLSEEAIDNFKSLLSVCEDKILRNWTLFSNNRGALSLQYHSEDCPASIICIAEKQISYVIEKKDTLKISGIEPFSPNSIISLLSKMA